LDQKISLKVDNESFDSVLEKVFKGSPISYKIESGKQVVLTLKTEQKRLPEGDKKTITGL
jgi:predicted oxidoreductase (fatty acid repression mutant protein)